MTNLPSHYPPLVFVDDITPVELRRAVRQGLLRRIARGIYSSEVARPMEEVVSARIWEIVGHELPGAVIADRSAREGGRPHDGELYVISDRKRPLDLPGVRVLARQGVGHLPGDMPLPDGIFLAGNARSLLENLRPTRPTARGTSRTLSRIEVEVWIDDLVATRGESAVNRMRDEARGLARTLDMHKEFALLDALIGAALNTRDDIAPRSEQLRRRAAGRPVDSQRLELFGNLVSFLEAQAPDTLPAMAEDASRHLLLPFYEAYFSNYIEGTEFTLDEAAEIVFDHVVPEQRPKDAHDVLGTYELTSSRDEMRRTPHSADELIELIRSRHAAIMAGRPETGPGRFKERANRAGSTEFVAPDLVDGTLRHGFEIGVSLVSPFSRAVYMMFLASEVHPFADGNGRTARIMMNAELEAAGEVRLIIPTVYRLNYLSALKAATHSGHFAALHATLAFARRWTARVNFTDRQTAEGDLERTHALRDAREAEDAGVRLILP